MRTILCVLVLVTTTLCADENTAVSQFLLSFIKYTNALSDYPIGKQRNNTALDAFSIMYARKTCWQNAALAIDEHLETFSQSSKEILDDAQVIALSMVSVLDSEIVGIKEIVDKPEGWTEGEAARKSAELKEKESQLQSAYNKLGLRVYGEILEATTDKQGVRHLRISLNEKQIAFAALLSGYGDRLKTATESSIMAWDAKLFCKALLTTKASDE
jgi:hypothetical protein